MCSDYRQKHESDHECEPVKDSESHNAGSLWIPKENVCNGYFDCRDKSDEADCPKVTEYIEFYRIMDIVLNFLTY